jgi:23S rRNA C2498 (ribose-2'-O)-methylase RlmM
MIITLIYKCRACDEAEVRTHELPFGTIVGALASLAVGSHMQHFHTAGCVEGVIGIMDLIGAKEE